MREAADRDACEGAYPLEYGIVGLGRWDVFTWLGSGLARLALNRGFTFRNLHFRRSRLICLGSKLSFRGRQRHLALATVATTLAPLTTMIAARVLGTED